MLSGFTGCTVLVPVFFKENAVKETGVEKAIVKQAPEAFEVTEVTVVPEATMAPVVPEATMAPEVTEAIVVTEAPEPPQHPIKEATIIPLTTRTVRYPRFLNRHRTTIHAIN